MRGVRLGSGGPARWVGWRGVAAVVVTACAAAAAVLALQFTGAGPAVTASRPLSVSDAGEPVAGGPQEAGELASVDLSGGVVPVAATSAKPPSPRTLAQLDHLMNKAIMAKGTVRFDQATVVTDGFVSRREAGVVRWTKGRPAFDVTESGTYVVERYVVLPGVVYSDSLKPDDGSAFSRTAERDLEPATRDYFTLLSRQMNPSLAYPGLSALKVSRGKGLKVDGVLCWPFTVRMTLRQNMAALPTGARLFRAPSAKGTTVTTFYVDVNGLPHKVVEASQEGHTRINLVTNLTAWGTPVAVTAPTDVTN